MNGCDLGDFYMPAYASLSRRFTAFIIDSLILFMPFMIAHLAMPVLGGLVVWFFYAPVLESSPLGATIGKHLMGIQVKDLSGGQITFRAAFVRNLLKIASTVLLLIGFVFALFSEKKQALHDLVADTTVVYGRSDLPIFDTWLARMKELFNEFKADVSPTLPGESTASSQKPPGSFVDELERLERLRTSGSLSEEEFQKAKRKILGDTGDSSPTSQAP